jgi:hypothetical protein
MTARPICPRQRRRRQIERGVVRLGVGSTAWSLDLVQTRTKVRTRTTAEAVVGGVVGSLEAPEALLLGRPDADGRLRIAG